MVTAAQLADELGVAEGDVMAVLDDFAPPPSREAVPEEIAAEVRRILDPNGERTGR